MHATLLDTTCLINDGYHHAFTSIAAWRGDQYCAHRTAAGHDITPPGHLTLWRRRLGQWHELSDAFPCYGEADLRDPRLLASDEALYCLAGAYLPLNGPGTHGTLSPRAHENVLVTLLSWTTDGVRWVPWRRLLRPNTWGWSAVAGREAWWVTAYHFCNPGEAQSLVLYAGTALWDLQPIGTIYEGASLEGEAHEDKTAAVHIHHRYPHAFPSEPVLWRPQPGVLACATRTEGRMDIGVAHARSSYQAWRWQRAPVNPRPTMPEGDQVELHPSAVLQMQGGTVLAARCVLPAQTARAGQTQHRDTPHRVTARLYALQGQSVHEVLTLPSAGDCAYAGLCQGPTPDTVLMSWYSQHAEWQKGRFQATLPGAGVYVGTVKIHH